IRLRLVHPSEVGQTIGLCPLLGWAFGPRELMKNCHGDFIATHERPRDRQDWHGFPAHFAGNSLPVLSVPGFGAHSPRWFFAPVCPKTVCPAPASVTLFAPLISYDYAVFSDSPPVCGSSVPGGPDTPKTSGASHSHRALHTRHPHPDGARRRHPAAGNNPAGHHSAGPGGDPGGRRQTHLRPGGSDSGRLSGKSARVRQW